MASISGCPHASVNPNFVHASRALKVVGIAAAVVATVSAVAIAILLAAPVLPAALVGAVALTGLTVKSAVIIGLFSAGVAVICRVALNRLHTPSSGSCQCSSSAAPAGSAGGVSSSSSSTAQAAAGAERDDRSSTTSPAAQAAAGADRDDLSGGIPSPHSPLTGSPASSNTPSVDDLRDLAASLTTPPRSPSPSVQASVNPSALAAAAIMNPSDTAAPGESRVALKGDEDDRDDSDDDGTGSHSSGASSRQSSTHSSPRQSPSASSDSVEAQPVDVKRAEPAAPSAESASKPEKGTKEWVNRKEEKIRTSLASGSDFITESGKDVVSDLEKLKSSVGQARDAIGILWVHLKRLKALNFQVSEELLGKCELGYTGATQSLGDITQELFNHVKKGEQDSLATEISKLQNLTALPQCCETLDLNSSLESLIQNFKSSFTDHVVNAYEYTIIALRYLVHVEVLGAKLDKFSFNPTISPAVKGNLILCLELKQLVKKLREELTTSAPSVANATAARSAVSSDSAAVPPAPPPSATSSAADAVEVITPAAATAMEFQTLQALNEAKFKKELYPFVQAAIDKQALALTYLRFAEALMLHVNTINEENKFPKVKLQTSMEYAREAGSQTAFTLKHLVADNSEQRDDFEEHKQGANVLPKIEDNRTVSQFRDDALEKIKYALNESTDALEKLKKAHEMGVTFSGVDYHLNRLDIAIGKLSKSVEDLKEAVEALKGYEPKSSSAPPADLVSAAASVSADAVEARRSKSAGSPSSKDEYPDDDDVDSTGGTQLTGVDANASAVAAANANSPAASASSNSSMDNGDESGSGSEKVEVNRRRASSAPSGSHTPKLEDDSDPYATLSGT